MQNDRKSTKTCNIMKMAMFIPIIDRLSPPNWQIMIQKWKISNKHSTKSKPNRTHNNDGDRRWLVCFQRYRRRNILDARRQTGHRLVHHDCWLILVCWQSLYYCLQKTGRYSRLAHGLQRHCSVSTSCTLFKTQNSHIQILSFYKITIN